MRKLFNFFAAALVMLAAASCEKNEVLPDNNSEGKVVTLKASINNGGTKTSLGPGVQEGSNPIQYPVYWSENDAIAVIQGSNVYKFTLKDGAGKTSATFQSESAEGFDPSLEATDAVYPYTTQLNFFVVQTNQKYAEKSFDSDAILMMASMEEGSLKFNNILGILKLTIKGASDETVSSIELTANKPISGNAKFFDTGEGPYIVTEGPDADYKNNIVLNCPDVEIATAKEFLITVPAGTYDFAVTINTNKGTYYKSTTNKEILNSVILNMLPLDLTDFENSMPYVENGVYLGEGVAIPVGEGKTIIWAPVNCGYDAVKFKYGKLYQWGRKDGQGYCESETSTNNDLGGGPEIENGPITWENYVAGNYSNAFFKVADDNPGDWVSPQNPDLWGNGTKTEHDPCPDGWRVPTNDELIGLTKNFKYSGNGYWCYGINSSDGSYPRILLRYNMGYHEYNADNGTKRNDTRAYYWSSTTDGANSKCVLIARDLYYPFDEMFVGKYSHPRANAYSVRCVKDMTQSQPMPGSN